MQSNSIVTCSAQICPTSTAKAAIMLMQRTWASTFTSPITWKSQNMFNVSSVLLHTQAASTFLTFFSIAPFSFPDWLHEHYEEGMPAADHFSDPLEDPAYSSDSFGEPLEPSQDVSSLVGDTNSSRPVFGREASIELGEYGHQGACSPSFYSIPTHC